VTTQLRLRFDSLPTLRCAQSGAPQSGEIATEFVKYSNQKVNIVVLGSSIAVNRTAASGRVGVLLYSGLYKYYSYLGLTSLNSLTFVARTDSRGVN
jgi:hypothetical protein